MYKVIIALMVVLLVCMVTTPTFAEVNSGLRVKAGLFMPGDSDVADLYGNGLVFGVEYAYPFSNKPYGILGSIDYFPKGATETVYYGGYLYHVDHEWRVIPITFSFIYFPSVGKNYYFGGGIGNYSATLDAELRETGQSESESESGIGFHILAGYNFSGGFFGRVKYSTADLEGTDAGGISFFGGYRF